MHIITRDKCGSYSLPKNLSLFLLLFSVSFPSYCYPPPPLLSFAADGDCYRDPQLVKFREYLTMGVSNFTMQLYNKGTENIMR